MKSKRKQLGKEIEKVVFPLAENLSEMPNSYASFVEDLKGFIKKEKLATLLNANQKMILMYWPLVKRYLPNKKRRAGGQK